jgi:hypothetical protein
MVLKVIDNVQVNTDNDVYQLPERELPSVFLIVIWTFAEI